jgi:PKD repeat protein
VLAISHLSRESGSASALSSRLIVLAILALLSVTSTVPAARAGGTGPAAARTLGAPSALGPILHLIGGSADRPVAGPVTNTSPPSWINLSPRFGVAPPPRADASFVYDPADQEFVLFGGYTIAFGGCSVSTPCPLRDTWVLKSGAWSNVTPLALTSTNSPSARWGASAAFDTVDGYVVLFGGTTAAFAAFTNPFLNDTWGFQGGTWSLVCAACVASTTPIAPRYDASLAFDRARGVAILFGGVEATTLSTVLTNESLQFAAGAWSTLATPVAPTPRSAAGFAFDNQTRTLVLFGGYGGSGDTWSFTSGAWSQLQPATAPGSRGGVSMVLDPLNGSVLLFGGCAAAGCAGGPLAATWEFSRGNWADLTGQLVASPSARSAMGAASTPLGSAILLLGGLGAAPQNDTWQWDQVVVATPTVLPATIDVGQSATASTVASSPRGGWHYLWLGLPPGCTSVDAANEVCQPSAAGSFPVTVHVRDAPGLQVVSFPATLTVNARPTATAQAAPTSGVVPLQVTFTAATTGGTPPFTFAWVFGDGSIGVGANPTHTYLGAGSFGVRLWANDSFGLSAESNLTVTTVEPFVTHLSIVPPVVVLGGGVTLYANATGGHGPYTETYQGLPTGCASQNSSTLACVPTAVGLYSVRVAIVDSAGAAQNVSGTVDVVLPIALHLVLTPATIVFGQSFTVNATVTGGDGTNTIRYTGLPANCAGNNRTTFTCRVDQVGTYTVNGTVTDSSGARARATAVLTVVSPPSTSTGGGGISSFWIALLLAVLVIAAIASLLLLQRRRRGPPIVPLPHGQVPPKVPPPADLYVPPRPKG